jgi:hypothetical protein
MEDFVNGETQQSGLDGILDEILPEGLDWERMVRSYPLPALALAVAGGFWLGLRHGPAVVAAVSSYATAQVSRNVSELFGQEIG